MWPNKKSFRHFKAKKMLPFQEALFLCREEGICLFLKSGLKQGFAKLFVLSDTSIDTSLF
jgi:hypothetical protein